MQSQPGCIDFSLSFTPLSHSWTVACFAYAVIRGLLAAAASRIPLLVSFLRYLLLLRFFFFLSPFLHAHCIVLAMMFIFFFLGQLFYWAWTLRILEILESMKECYPQWLLLLRWMLDSVDMSSLVNQKFLTERLWNITITFVSFKQRCILKKKKESTERCIHFFLWNTFWIFELYVSETVDFLNIVSRCFFAQTIRNKKGISEIFSRFHRSVLSYVTKFIFSLPPGNGFKLSALVPLIQN